MKPLIPFMALVLCLVTVLMGCHRSTTVILPPDTDPSTETTSASTGSTNTSTAGPTTAPTTEPTTVPTTEPSTVLSTEPPPVPTTEPSTVLSTEPPPVPTTEPTTAPTTEPMTEPTADPVYDISDHYIGTLEYALLDGINGKRADQNLEPLTLDTTLCALARIRAYECTESFTQTRPDGRSGYSVVTDYGYDIWSDFSQRLHYGSSSLSAGTILKGWMNTAVFSADILGPDFSHIGIGVYEQGGLTYIVCFFVR